MKYLFSFVSMLFILFGCIIDSPIIINGFTVTPEKESVDYGEVITIKVNISYQGENDLDFKWTTTHGTIANNTLQTIEWTAPEESAEAKLTVVISNGIPENEISKSLTINVNEIIPEPITFNEYQLIGTNRARDWEHFTINNQHFLVVANNYNGSSVAINSTIYTLDNSSYQFVSYQNIQTYEATDWKYVPIDDIHLLLVANFTNGPSYNTLSNCYSWSTNQTFTLLQTFQTNGAVDWEYFTIGTDKFIVISNFYNGTTYNVPSQIYKWDGSLFSLHQSIDTNGAEDWEFFTINNEYYLSVANNCNGNSFIIFSGIYKWNPDTEEFITHQNIATCGAADWEYFTINDEHYLAVANFENASTNQLNSTIYKWDSTIEQFTLFQNIPTCGAIDWEYFTINDENYLALANYRDGTNYNIDSYIYKWNPDTSEFATYIEIPTHGASDWEYFTMNNGHYLALANSYNNSTTNINSVIYRIE
ncbi:MAG: hypothetical protein JXJ04_05140 [Spirochaetales bacterium]|nr:hypothetical protein [Spirochaetales bacterium]